MQETMLPRETATILMPPSGGIVSFPGYHKVSTRTLTTVRNSSLALETMQLCYTGTRRTPSVVSGLAS